MTKTIYKIIPTILLVSMTLTLTSTEQYKEDKNRYYTMLSQISTLSTQYSRSLEDYSILNQKYTDIQVGYNEVFVNESKLKIENFDLKENLEVTTSNLDFAEKEVEALQEVSFNFDVEYNERLLLSQILYTEAQAEPLEGKLAVLQVIMNRVANDDFPNTVENVIKDDGQFSGYNHYNWGRTSNLTDYAVFAYVDLGMRAENISEDILYFYSFPTTAFLRSLTVETQIGGHCFCTD